VQFSSARISVLVFEVVQVETSVFSSLTSSLPHGIADKKQLGLCGIFLLMIETGKPLRQLAVWRHW